MTEKQGYINTTKKQQFILKYITSFYTFVQIETGEVKK